MFNVPARHTGTDALVPPRGGGLETYGVLLSFQNLLPRVGGMMWLAGRGAVCAFGKYRVQAGVC